MIRPAVLMLESGRMFRGQAYGAPGETVAEVVFNTSLTGYQEVVSDPSYAGQIVVMTAPEIGNTGVNDEDAEAAAPACAGLAIREASPVPSSWRSRGDLGSYLENHGIVAIEGIDTRALTRALREGGAQRGAISDRIDDLEGLRARIAAAPAMDGRDLASAVSCAEAYSWDDAGWRSPDESSRELAPAAHHVVAFDFGIKRQILRDLRSAGCRVTVVPAATSAAEALAHGADGYLLSNGPGDPAALGYAIEAARELVRAEVPVFGICLGHQILSLALGARTFKLPFGHHGGNHPVLDLETEKVEITSHNHGFAVHPELPKGLRCTHVNLYDQTVEGIRLEGRRAFGIQYHPEASPGPHDASYHFRRFVDAMRE